MTLHLHIPLLCLRYRPQSHPCSRHRPTFRPGRNNGRAGAGGARKSRLTQFPAGGDESEEDGRPGVMFEVGPACGRERHARGKEGSERDGYCWSSLDMRLTEMVFGVAFIPEMAIRVHLQSTRFGRHRQLM